MAAVVCWATPLAGMADPQPEWLDLNVVWQLPTQHCERIFIANDPDVSSTLEFVKRFEPFSVNMFLRVLDSSCQFPNAVFVDSGANDGAWSLLAASRGCRVIAFEPQPRCSLLLSRAAKRNDFDIDLRNQLVSPEPTWAQVEPQRCIGQAQFAGNQQRIASSGGARRLAAAISIGSSRLDVALGQLPNAIVQLWHVDVEGAEILALRSARALFAADRILRVLVESVPLRWGVFNLSVAAGLREAAAIFEDWHCVVACSGKAYAWQVATLGLCSEELQARGVRAADVYCSKMQPWWEDAGMKVLARPQDLRRARRAAAIEHGCTAQTGQGKTPDPPRNRPLPPAVVRLAVLTYAGIGDDPDACHRFVAWYGLQQVPTQDLHVLVVEAPPPVVSCFERHGAQLHYRHVASARLCPRESAKRHGPDASPRWHQHPARRTHASASPWSLKQSGISQRAASLWHSGWCRNRQGLRTWTRRCSCVWSSGSCSCTATATL